MVLFIGYHATSRRFREDIRRYGLIAHRPAPFMPSGVYVFSDSMQNPALQRVHWTHRRPQDLWRVVYCGPMQPDPFVENAVILPSVTSVTLVTGNN